MTSGNNIYPKEKIPNVVENYDLFIHLMAADIFHIIILYWIIDALSRGVASRLQHRPNTHADVPPHLLPLGLTQRRLFRHYPATTQ